MKKMVHPIYPWLKMWSGSGCTSLTVNDGLVDMVVVKPEQLLKV